MTTIRKILKGSLQRLGVSSANSEPTAEETAIALSSFNSLIDSLSNSMLNVFTVTPHRFPVTGGKQEYLLGPALDINGDATGADWVIDRPMRIENAVLMAYPVINYGPSPAPPPPPPAVCTLVSSDNDANTIDLWHFDEAAGETSVTPTVDSVGNYEPRILSGFQLEQACCDNGLYSFNDTAFDSEIMLAVGDATLVNGFAIEFSLSNNGTTSPGVFDYAEVFRTDLITYAGGEGVGTIRGYKVGQNLNIVLGIDVENPIVTMNISQVNCNPIAIVSGPIIDNDATVSFYSGGVRVLMTTYSALFSLSETTVPVASFSYFSPSSASAKSQLKIDEFRRSNFARYTLPTYDPGVNAPPEPACPYEPSLAWSIAPVYNAMVQTLPNPTPYAGVWTLSTPNYTISNGNRTITMNAFASSTRADLGSLSYRNSGVAYAEFKFENNFDVFGLMTEKIAEAGSSLPFQENFTGAIFGILRNQNNGSQFFWIRKWTAGVFAEFYIPMPVWVDSGQTVGFHFDADAGNIINVTVNNIEVLPAMLPAGDLTTWNTNNNWTPGVPVRMHSQNRGFGPNMSMTISTSAVDFAYQTPTGASPFDCFSITP